MSRKEIWVIFFTLDDEINAIVVAIKIFIKKNGSIFAVKHGEDINTM